MQSPPQASIVVCTRNRPSDIVACIQAILANDAPPFDVIVIDQSDGPETREALRTAAAGRPVRYFATETRGLSRARNLGIEKATAPIILFTDDDCRPQPEWVRESLRVFENDPLAQLMFGRVTVPEELLESGGFAAAFEPERRVWDGVWPGRREQWGIGANLAARKTLFARVGPFDPMLGAGTRNPAAEDYDLAIRCLDANLRIINAAESVVIHLGVRPPAEVRKLIVGYFFGIGVAFGKHIRTGSRKCVQHFLVSLLFLTRDVLFNFIRGKRPTKAGQLLNFVRGTIASFSMRIDSTTHVFIEQD